MKIKFQILEIDTFRPLSVKLFTEKVKDIGDPSTLSKTLNTIHSTNKNWQWRPCFCPSEIKLGKAIEDLPKMIPVKFRFI
jgi:hypothetical protein